MFTGFGPAVSKDALKKISAEVRSWRLHVHTDLVLRASSREWINPVVRGWMQYYGAFYRSGAVSASPPHQRLPGAVDAEEVQAAEDLQESARGMEAGNRPVSHCASRTGSGSTGIW